jgi:hypothetical protein
MRMHELFNPKQDTMVINASKHCVVISTSGAVWNNFMTDDLAYMAVASADLFKDDWRIATDDEYVEWMKLPNTPILFLYNPAPRKS